MSEEDIYSAPPNMPQDMPPAPDPLRTRQRAWLPSLIWLIPILAALIGLSLVAKTLFERGPEITISFLTAEGLEVGRTKVKYKDVDIGTVQAISLSEDRSHVLVKVQLKREARSFTAQDTLFWVVRPRIAVTGVSGLGTLFSGAYIGADAGFSEERSNEFNGLESPPIITRDASGKQFVLHAEDIGSLDIGSPVYYRRVKVGQLSAFDLDADGKGVTLRVFVNAPYDKFVGADTRFWHASGFDVQVSTGGFKLNTQSLATLVLGGLAFQSPDDKPGPPASENTEFLLAEDMVEAMKAPDGEAQTLLLYFNHSVRGLRPGATVDFRGVELGEVKSIGVEYDAEQHEFSMPVLVQIYPDRLGRKFSEAQRKSRYTAEQRIRFMISRGLRAQLRMANLLTGQTYVALDFFPKAAPVKRDEAQTPIVLPTIPTSTDELQTQIAGIVEKLSQVPFDKIGRNMERLTGKLSDVPYDALVGDTRQTLASLQHTLASAEQLMQNLNNNVAPEIVAAMKDVRTTLDSAQRTLAADAPLQQDLRNTLHELSRAAASLRVLTEYLERHPEAILRGKPKDKP
jgi:paraquat-inducible protein B